MKTTPSTLIHLARQAAPGNGPPPLLILLHGFGSNEQDLFSMAPYLNRRFQIVSARAPYTLMPGGYTWFELGITESGGTVLIKPAQVEASRVQIVQFIGEAITNYGADPARVYLMGFSQGAMMSALVALNRPDLVAGTVLMSGSIPPETRPLIAPHEQLAGKPFLVVHGTMDTLLPIRNGREIRDLLASLPVKLGYKEYPMGHEVSTESLSEVVGWLDAQLGEK